MNIAKAGFFRSGLAKKVKNYVAAPAVSQTVFHLSENGVGDIELRPISAGWMSHRDAEVKQIWQAIHPLKFKVYLNGVPTDDEVFITCDRVYRPLDPNNILKPKDYEKMASLPQIAVIRHDECFADANKANVRSKFKESVVMWSFIYLLVLVIGTLVREKVMS